MKGQRVPAKVTLDAYAAWRVRLRSSKYTNNLIEQDHRRIMQRLRPILGLKSFERAKVTVGGIELAEKIKKGQKAGGPSGT